MNASRPLLIAGLGLLLSALLLHAGDTRLPSESVPLDNYMDQGSDWDYSKGAEFKGAKGSLIIVPEPAAANGLAFKLSADFNEGGRYVGMGKSLELLGVGDIRAFRMKIKTANASEIGIRLVDSSGQLHQTKGLKLQPDGEWHDYTWPVEKLSGGEHWGGANDGVWHGPGKSFFLALKDNADPAKKPVLLIADIRADTVSGNQPAVTYLDERFDAGSSAAKDWTFEGDAGLTDGEKFSGTHSLRLSRSADKFDVVTTAGSPARPVHPGIVEVSGAFKSALVSPDNSFNAMVLLQCLDAQGKITGSLRIADYSGEHNWTPLKKQVEIPSGTTAARLHIVMNKAAGSFWADDLAFASVAQTLLKKSPVKRILLKTASPGNMLLPGVPVIFDLTAESLAPLPEANRKVHIVVRDYWGAEQFAVESFPLTFTKRANGVFPYQTVVDLSAHGFETGKYYEVHASLDDGSGESATEFSSFVILPEAVTKKYPWREIPFSTRNWDNRLRDYFVLSDRIGIRLAGVWGTWNPEPPYKPAAPQFDLCEKLDMGVLSRTPIVSIEHHQPGYEKYTEASLREGIREFFVKYGKSGRLVKVLGNEPATSGETVATNVANYKLMYEEIKKTSPETFVVGTSVGASEEYFKLGFHRYSDAVDFHSYEDSAGIRKTFERYHELFEKYGHAQPIWSTELGLNSQGLPRRTVATELIRKFSWFFSCGGANASWFGICYPDRTGKLRGATDDSHNVFNGTYGLYSPRLDALAYYNMVNAICIKKFVTHKTYADGIESFLFRDRDGANLQILWGARAGGDVSFPLPGADKVELIRIDGIRRTIAIDGSGLTLHLGEDPVLLLYTGSQDTLPGTLGQPAVKLDSAPALITRGEPAGIVLTVANALKNDLTVILPEGWTRTAPTITPAFPGTSRVAFEIRSPANTETRFVPVELSLPGANLPLFIPVQGQIATGIGPSVTAEGAPAVELVVRNNNAVSESVDWQLALTQEIPVEKGTYSVESRRSPAAYFAESPQGSLELPAHGVTRIQLPLAKADPLHAYKVAATVTDRQGRATATDRYVGGFVAVPRAVTAPALDGVLDETGWTSQSPRLLNEERQFRHLLKTSSWTGPADLSGELRFLWDERCLYVGVKVVDDVFHNDTRDGGLWAGDSLQFIIDPARNAADKPGKYDYGMALTNKGPQAWCFLSADSRAPAGEAADIVVAVHKAGDGTGAVSYEVAIPWIRLAPFIPAPGADLGLAMAINEDDTPKRDGFMAWFGDIQTKEVTPVGDLILQP